MQIKTILLATLIPCCSLIVACNNTGSDSSAIDARHDIMKNWKDATGIMRGMIENPEKFDVAMFQEQAQFLADDASNPWQHFTDTEEKVNNSTPAWISDSQTFKAEADKFEKTTAELNAVAQTATSATEVNTAFEQVVASCKSCHKSFKP